MPGEDTAVARHSFRCSSWWRWRLQPNGLEGHDRIERGRNGDLPRRALLTVDYAPSGVRHTGISITLQCRYSSPDELLSSFTGISQRRV